MGSDVRFVPQQYHGTHVSVGSKPEVVVAWYRFRFAPENGRWYACSAGPLWAITRIDLIR
jgi:hypothetical protein